MKRPLSVTLVGWLFITAGVVGIAYHYKDWTGTEIAHDAFWVLGIRLLAILGGALVLCKWGPARWLLVFWMLFHVAISFQHSAMEVAIHILFTVILVLALFNRKASQYFK